MKNVSINIPGVCSKCFDLDNDLEFIYYECGKVVTPLVYVKVNNNLVSTGLSIEDMISMQ